MKETRKKEEEEDDDDPTATIIPATVDGNDHDITEKEMNDEDSSINRKSKEENVVSIGNSGRERRRRKRERFYGNENDNKSSISNNGLTKQCGG